jgi:hypothetical protein
MWFLVIKSAQWYGMNELLQNILHVQTVQTKCLSLASSNTSITVLTSDDSPASDISSRQQEQSVKPSSVPRKQLLLFRWILLTTSNLKKTCSVKRLGVRGSPFPASLPVTCQQNHCSLVNIYWVSV